MKMFAVLFLFLAGCAVRCDNSNNNNYVIEMPEENITRDSYRKPLKVYWNVPTMQCRSKKIPFQNLFEKYGIIQNEGDSFRGDKIAILYDPGLFPALLTNETSKTLVYRNGGVPQEGDLEKHREQFRSIVNQSVTDPHFDGIGVLDFESWRPIFRQNFGVLTPYKDISYDIERKRHWWWIDEWIKAEANTRFEQSAHKFMETSIAIAKEMRPKAVWGYYGFPHCFNSLTANIQHCSHEVKQENDRTSWLWSQSSALFPSVYSSESLNTSQLVAFIRGRITEATRVGRKGAPILPYFWFRYRDGGFLTQRDLKAALQTFYKSKADGFIIWGSSGDVNTVDKCNELLNYIDKIMGPAIAKYTKVYTKDDINNDVQFDDESGTESIVESNELSKINETAYLYATVKPENKFQLRPEKDILKYIKEKYQNETGLNFDTAYDDDKKINETILLEIILKADKQDNLESSTEAHKIRHKNSKKGHAKRVTSTTSSFRDELLTTVENENPSTESNLDSFTVQSTSTNVVLNNSTNVLVHKQEEEGRTEVISTSEVYSTADFYSTTEIYTNPSTIKPDTIAYITEETNDLTTTSTNSDFNEKYIFNVTSLLNNDGNIYSTTDIYTDNENYFNESSTSFNVMLELTTKDTLLENSKARQGIVYVNLEENSSTQNVFAVTDNVTETGDINAEKADIHFNTDKKEIFENKPNEDTTLTTPSGSSKQVFNSSSQVFRSHQYFICFFFYFYSITNCLCDIYNLCT